LAIADSIRLAIGDSDWGLTIGLRIGDWIADWRLDCGLAISIANRRWDRQSPIAIDDRQSQSPIRQSL
jgi:hypothetical protein